VRRDRELFKESAITTVVNFGSSVGMGGVRKEAGGHVKGNGVFFNYYFSNR
jgi:hypothetical protein